MWDEHCEAEMRSLLDGFTSTEGKPPLERQRETAARLNQRLPYPGWELRLVGVRADGKYWVVVRDGFWAVYHSDRYYLMKHTACLGETLIEALTTLEMGLCAE